MDESLRDGGAWTNAADGWKYCYTDGYCARSKYVTIDGDTYYFNGDAVMATGWVTFDGAWHWMTPSGRMARAGPTRRLLVLPRSRHRRHGHRLG